jgi:hypothetical protein
MASHLSPQLPDDRGATGAIAKYGLKGRLTPQYGSIAACRIVCANPATRVGLHSRRTSLSGAQALSIDNSRYQLFKSHS